jgi:hypothetical protein
VRIQPESGWPRGEVFAWWLRLRKKFTIPTAGAVCRTVPGASARICQRPLMHRLIRDSRLHVYPGGHLSLVTEAARLAPVVDGFLAAP